MPEPILNNQQDQDLFSIQQTQQLLDVFQRGLAQIRDSIKAGVDVDTPAWATSPFVTISTTADLTNERALTGTANQIILTDNGAGSTIVLSTPQSIDTGATIQFSKLTLTSWFTGSEISANPVAGDLTSLGQFAIYQKADKFVIAYNNAGTMTYITLDMNGSDTSWSHGTTAP